MKKASPATTEQSPSERITQHIKGIGDWRGPLMTRLRKLIGDAAPDIVEDWKWETPVFAHKGNVLALGTFKDHIKKDQFFQRRVARRSSRLV